MDKEGVEYYSALKEYEILPLAATWMDIEIIILSEVNQRNTNIIYHLYVKSKEFYKWTHLQNRNRLTDTENKPMVTKGEGGAVW